MGSLHSIIMAFSKSELREVIAPYGKANNLDSGKHIKIFTGNLEVTAHIALGGNPVINQLRYSF